MKIHSYRIEFKQEMYERIIKIHLTKKQLKEFLKDYKYDKVTIWEEVL